MIKFTPEQIKRFPVAHLSYSAIRCWMTDRQKFFKNYIRLEFEDFSSPAMVEGKAYHKALEYFWNGVKTSSAPIGVLLHDSFPDMLNIANDHIVDAVEKGNVDFGKTGSVEKSMKTVETALGFYRDELPEYHPIAVEAKIKAECADLNGEILPVMLKSVHDLVSEGETFDLVDHKLVTSFEDENAEIGSPVFEIQAGCSFFTALAQFGKKPDRMIFDQLKKSKNKDGSPQRKPYIIEFFDTNGNPHRCLPLFLELYRRVVMELAGLPLIDNETNTMRFLPNPFGMFGIEESWLDFCREVLTPGAMAIDIQALKQKAETVEALDIE